MWDLPSKTTRYSEPGLGSTSLKIHPVHLEANQQMKNQEGERGLQGQASPVCCNKITDQTAHFQHSLYLKIQH